MVADQSGRGARRSRREDSAARIPTGQAELEQQHHELLEEAHESAVRETQKSEQKQRLEISRRDQSSIAARTRASVRVMGATTSVASRVEENAGNRTGLQEERGVVEQRDVHDEHSEMLRNEREDLPWVQGGGRQEVGRASEEQWQQPHGQRDVRDEVEVAVTEEDLRTEGWSDSDIGVANCACSTATATISLWS